MASASRVSAISRAISSRMTAASDLCVRSKDRRRGVLIHLRTAAQEITSKNRAASTFR